MSHSLIDIFAIIWFFSWWVVYGIYAEKTGKTLGKVIHRYRIQWVKNMVHHKHSERLVDVRVVANLQKSATFLASTSVLIIGGFVAILDYGDQALPIIQTIPLVAVMPDYMWIVKTIVLIMIFVYSFFKLTWVVRQFNIITILMLAAPTYCPEEDSYDQIKRQTWYVSRISALLTNSARHFNLAVRSYYFGGVALSWYISPILLMALTVIVVFVLFRREFRSRANALLV